MVRPPSTGNFARIAQLKDKIRLEQDDLLSGDSTKARTALGWKFEVPFRDLVTMMVDADLARQRGEPVSA